jgi:hypothetical protein
MRPFPIFPDPSGIVPDGFKPLPLAALGLTWMLWLMIFMLMLLCSLALLLMFMFRFGAEF